MGSRFHISGDRGNVMWCGDKDAFDWLKTVLLHARDSVIDQLRASWIKFHLLVDTGKLEKGVHHAIDDLGSLVGVKLRLKNTKLHTAVALTKTRRVMCGHDYTSLLQHSPLTGEKMALALHYLNAVALISAAVVPNLLPLICFKLLELNLKHGISTTMPAAVAWYGVI